MKTQMIQRVCCMFNNVQVHPSKVILWALIRLNSVQVENNSYVCTLALEELNTQILDPNSFNIFLKNVSVWTSPPSLLFSSFHFYFCFAFIRLHPAKGLNCISPSREHFSTNCIVTCRTVIEFSLYCFLDTFSFVLFFYLFRKPFSFGYTVFDFLSHKNMKNSKTFVHWKHTSNLCQLPLAVTAAARMFWSVCGICPALRLMLWHSNRAACH